jgi:hypothetical protein
MHDGLLGGIAIVRVIMLIPAATSTFTQCQRLDALRFCRQTGHLFTKRAYRFNQPSLRSNVTAGSILPSRPNLAAHVAMNRLAIVLLPLLLGAASAEPTLGRIRIQLYYKASGTLSADIAPPARVSLWNTGAGEGYAKEPAEDLLVSVPIRMPPGSDAGENNEVPLTISVRAKSGKLLASRKFDFISIPYKDPVWNPLWINGVQCAGPIIATATWGKQRQTAAISLDCGE